jgi:hypothetical protein
MSARPALVTEADLRRIIRAAVKEAARVTIRIEKGKPIRVDVNGEASAVEEDREIVL